MKKLYSHFRSLALLLLCSAAVAQCMETQENKPITWAQTYHGLSKFLIKDVMPLIFSFHLDTSNIDYANLPALIKESSKSVEKCVKTMHTFLNSDNHTLVAEIFERAFAHEKISICDIRDMMNWTVLHDASANGYQGVVKIILDIAGDKTWDLLTIKTSYDCTALYLAVTNNYIGIIELLIDAAGKRAQEFIDIQDNTQETAFYFAGPYAKEAMRKKLRQNQSCADIVKK